VLGQAQRHVLRGEQAGMAEVEPSGPSSRMLTFHDACAWAAEVL